MFRTIYCMVVCSLYCVNSDVNPGTSIEVYDGNFSWNSHPSGGESENEQDDELITDGTSDVDDDELIDDYHNYNSNNGLPAQAKPLCLQNISFRVQKVRNVGLQYTQSKPCLLKTWSLEK